MNAKHRSGYRLFEILSPLVFAIILSLGLTQTQSNLTKNSLVEANQTTDFAVGRSPDAILFDGTNIWVANQLGDNLMKLNASDG